MGYERHDYPVQHNCDSQHYSYNLQNILQTSCDDIYDFSDTENSPESTYFLFLSLVPN